MASRSKKSGEEVLGTGAARKAAGLLKGRKARLEQMEAEAMGESPRKKPQPKKKKDY